MICVAADVGQGEELSGLDERAKQQGAETCIVKDLREQFVARGDLADAARGCDLRAQVSAGHIHGAADHCARGRPSSRSRSVRTRSRTAAPARATTRFVSSWRTPRLRRNSRSSRRGVSGISARVRMRSTTRLRAASRLAATKEKIYSRDRNLWHISHEGGPLEDPANEPPEDMYMLTQRRRRTRRTRAQYIEIGFESGYPVTVDGEVLSPVQMIELLNEIGGRHGIGRADIVEDRLVGMKSRGVYETPGGTLLYTAHRELEQLVLDRRTLALKDQVAARYADLVYEGRWWAPSGTRSMRWSTRRSSAVTGHRALKLYKGNAIIAGRTSPFSLYDEGLASFGDDGNYDHADAEGFIRLFALPTRADARQQDKRAERCDGWIIVHASRTIASRSSKVFDR